MWAWHPFFNSSFRAYIVIILDFTWERVSSKEKYDSCVFCNFLCFGGCLVNCFSSNTPWTCLDSVGIHFFHIFFGDLGLSNYIFFLFDGFSNPEIQLFNLFVHWMD